MIFPERHKLMTLEEAAGLIEDGDTVAVGGEFQARTPTALVKELIRQGKKDLHLVCHASGFAVDLACGGGIVGILEVTQLSFEREWGLAPNFKRCVEKGVIKVKEACCPVLNQQLRASVLGLPYLPMDGNFIPTSIMDFHPEYKVINCPFTGRKQVLVPKIQPDVTVLHVHKADPAGNWKIESQYFHDLLFAQAAKKVIVTVEEVVSNEEIKEEIAPYPYQFPYFKTTAVIHVPFGAHPASCYPRYTYDKSHISMYVELARAGPDRFREYLNNFVYGCKTYEEYLEKIGGTRTLTQLQSWRNVLFEFRSVKKEAEAVGEYGIDEMMVVCLARCIEDGDAAVHGGNSPLPMVALRLAKLTHAPNMVYFAGMSGALNPEPPFLPRNSNDVWYMHGAEAIIPFEHVFDFCEREELDVMFFSGAQIDKYGNVNSSLIGAVNNIKVKFPGGGGTCQMMGKVKKNIIWTTGHRKMGNRYKLVDKIDFVTGHGYTDKIQNRKPYKLISELGVFGFDEESGIMKLEALYPDTTVEDVLENTEFKPILPSEVSGVKPPTPEELHILRHIADPTDVRQMEFTQEQLKRKFRLTS